MKNVTIWGISGSPRDGNTDVLLREVLKAAEAEGAKTKFVKLTKMDMKPCIGDLTCSKTKKCIYNDDIQKMAKEFIEEADGVIFGSPVYFKSMTGQMKIFSTGCSLTALETTWGCSTRWQGR